MEKHQLAGRLNELGVHREEAEWSLPIEETITNATLDSRPVFAREIFPEVPYPRASACAFGR